MESSGMPEVSLRGVNDGFWSHLGCSGQNATIFNSQGIFYGCTRRKKWKTLLWGQIKLGPHPDWSLLGVSFKLSNEHPLQIQIQNLKKLIALHVPCNIPCSRNVKLHLVTAGLVTERKGCFDNPKAILDQMTSAQVVEMTVNNNSSLWELLSPRRSHLTNYWSEGEGLLFSLFFFSVGDTRRLS